ncbi:alcohol dehydrogenase catalytic domain-containing protein [Actinomadura luteofluorescens]|uniref:alcohol dehydrogenase catalytic domain-containing protein n=1 Tax=Actinomadura luteofluorescens TaxID=46163 RepID=UPI0036453858
MRAVTYDSYADDNSRLKVGDVPDPKVGPGQVLIEVRAAGVNPVDWKVMTGGLDGMMDAVFPVIPGWDVAGVVRGRGPTPRSSRTATRSCPTPARTSSVPGRSRSTSRSRRTTWRAGPRRSTGTRPVGCRSSG